MKENETINQQNNMEPAIRNWELYWVKRPMNEMRVREHLPVIDNQQLAEQVQLEQGKVVEIAQKQREDWP